MRRPVASVCVGPITNVAGGIPAASAIGGARSSCRVAWKLRGATLGNAGRVPFILEPIPWSKDT